MKSNEFLFNYAYLLFYKCDKANLKRSVLCIDFPNWIKNKKATINTINKER